MKVKTGADKRLFSGDGGKERKKQEKLKKQGCQEERRRKYCGVGWGKRK